MIQDIAPQRIHNEFLPECEPKEKDIVICIKGNTMMAGGSPGVMRFPEYGEISDVQGYRYLFSLDRQRVFLADGEDIAPMAGFSYLTLKEIRWQMKGPLSYMYTAYTAWHIAAWYRDNRFCGRCGHRTHHAETERAVVCSACGNIIYPRIIPAVIVGVINGDELLLTRYANRDIPFYALVAGFTEIGETLEECVAREVMEETGLRVKNIRYYKSQPWGNVQDLLMGFYCDVDGDPAIHIDKNELKEGLWMKREDIQGQLDDWSLTHHMMMTFKEGREPRGTLDMMLHG